MPSNKDRLYVVLHARSTTMTMPEVEERYHWALVVAPKIEKEGDHGIRFHARNVIRDRAEVWVREEVSIDVGPSKTTLVRVRIAKILDTPGLLEVLRNIPVRPELPGWNCVSWVQEALQKLQSLQQQGVIMGRGNLEWKDVRDAAMAYVKRKVAEGRFDRSALWDTHKIPTWDLLTNREATP